MVEALSGKVEADKLNRNFSALESKIDSVDGGPLKIFKTEAELKATFPSGANGYCVADGFMYWWESGQWVKGKAFVPSEYDDFSITNIKVKDEGLTPIKLGGVKYPKIGFVGYDEMDWGKAIFAGGEVRPTEGYGVTPKFTPTQELFDLNLYASSRNNLCFWDAQGVVTFKAGGWSNPLVIPPGTVLIQMTMNAYQMPVITPNRTAYSRGVPAQMTAKEGSDINRLFLAEYFRNKETFSGSTLLKTGLVTTDNLITAEDIIEGGYLIGNVLYKDPDYWGIVPKKISPNTKYETTSTTYRVQYDKDMNPIKFEGLGGVSKVFTSEPNAAYVTVNFAKTEKAPVLMKLGGDSSMKPAGTFADLVGKSGVGVNEKAVNRKWAVLGDSLSSDGDYPVKTWIRLLAEKYKGVVTNYGISGTTVAHSHERHLWDYHFGRLDADEIGYVPNDSSTWHTGNCMWERVDKLDQTADFVFFMGSTNDSASKKGSWNSTDMATLYGATNTLFIEMKTKYAGKPIFCILPPQARGQIETLVENASSELDSKSADSVLSLQLRCELIRRVANKHNIPVIDLFNDGGITNETVYYLPNDTLHLSQLGQNRIAGIIEAELLKAVAI